MSPVQAWFDAIYEENFKLLLRTAMHLLRDRQLAEDMVQTVFLTLLSKHEGLQDHPNIRGWLIQTLKYQIQSELQRARYSREVPLTHDQVIAAEEPHEPDFLSLLPTELSSSEKMILYLHIEVGLTHEEIAERMGCSTEASRMRLYRAKRRCKKFLEKISK